MTKPKEPSVLNITDFYRTATTKELLTTVLIACVLLGLLYGIQYYYIQW